MGKSLSGFPHAPKWCNVVQILRILPMSRPRSLAKPRIGASDVTRASVSFPTETYAELERIAASKKVSVAWVVREAAERYVADQWPLLASTVGRSEK